MFRKKTAEPASKLKDLLATYPPSIPPHNLSNGSLTMPGVHKLTLAQAEENLAWYKSVLDERLDLLNGLLSEFGIVLDDIFADNRRHQMLVQLDAMCVAELPALGSPATTDFEQWLVSSRSGPFIVHTFLHDVAMLFDTLIVRARPGAYVDLARDRSDRDMEFYLRPCVFGTVDRLFPELDNCFYHPQEMFGLFRRCVRGEAYELTPAHLPETNMIERLDRAVVPAGPAAE